MGQYKQGLDYFPFTIGLLKDRKLRRPKLKFGCVVNDIYLSVLELIYGDKGYFLLYDENTKDDVNWEILENLQGKYCPTAETVEQVIEDLVACGLFSGDHFKSKILTSKRIQQTYYSATVERKAVDIDFDVWILTEEEMRKLSSTSIILKKFLNRSNEEYNRSNEEYNRSNERESKVNKSSTLSKDNNIINSASACARNKEMFVRNADRGNQNVENLRGFALLLHKTDNYVDITLNALDELQINVDNLSAHILGEIANRIYKYNPTNPKAYIEAILKNEGIIKK